MPWLVVSVGTSLAADGLKWARKDGSVKMSTSDESGVYNGSDLVSNPGVI